MTPICSKEETFVFFHCVGLIVKANLNAPMHEIAELLAFVKKLSQITRGKAYLTSPRNIGKYLLLDFLNKKVRRN